MTTAQIKGVFAFSIIQNRAQLINNLNQNGYRTSMSISDQDLVDKLYTIYIQNGFEEINTILAGIVIPASGRSEAVQLRNSFLAPGSDVANQKTFLETLQELWAGAKDVIGGTKTTTTGPAISPAVAGITLVVFAAIIGVILWKA